MSYRLVVIPPWTYRMIIFGACFAVTGAMSQGFLLPPTATTLLLPITTSSVVSGKK